MRSILEQIKAETAEMIAARARELGLSVDDYLRSLLPPANGQDEAKPFYETGSVLLWSARSASWVRTPITSDTPPAQALCLTTDSERLVVSHDVIDTRTKTM